MNYGIFVILCEKRVLLFLAIAKHLNENGYKSARGKLFKNLRIHLILKNKLVADNRINKRYEPSIENLRIKLKII